MMARSAQTACRATKRQRPPPATSPQPRTKFSGQRDRPGEKANLSQVGKSHQWRLGVSPVLAPGRLCQRERRISALSTTR